VFGTQCTLLWPALQTGQSIIFYLFYNCCNARPARAFSLPDSRCPLQVPMCCSTPTVTQT
jgi:hypothetical protein